MKIFLCRSRERGQKLAGALKEWMVGAVPGLTERDVFVSTEHANIPAHDRQSRRGGAQSPVIVSGWREENSRQVSGCEPSSNLTIEMQPGTGQTR